MFQDITRDNAGATVTSIHPTLDECLVPHMREHVRKLKQILPVISVSIMALRQQNAELDEDIASVLHQHAVDPLDIEIEDLEGLLESLAKKQRKEVLS
jgi:hypothetical protein